DQDPDAVAPQLERGREPAVPGADDRNLGTIRQRWRGRLRGRRGLPPIRGLLEVGRGDVYRSHHSPPWGRAGHRPPAIRDVLGRVANSRTRSSPAGTLPLDPTAVVGDA